MAKLVVTGWQIVPLSQQQMDLIEAAVDGRLEEGETVILSMPPKALKDGEIAEMAQMADGTVIFSRHMACPEEE